MNRDKWMKILTIVCVLVLAAAAIMAVSGIFGGSIGGYANAEKYTAGDTVITDEVKNIDVNWTSGKVTVAYHAENTVTVSETAGRELKEDQKLRWWMDGDTLRIQYAKNGFRINWDLEKELTLTLPEGIRLETAEISLTSGIVDIPEMAAETLKVEVTSGEIKAKAEAKKAKFQATSGVIGVDMAGETEKLEIEATSGKINAKAEKADEVRISATSGAIEASVKESKKTDVSTTSGKIKVTLYKMDELNISCTSGTVTALLPAEPGFTADVSQTSGDFSSSLAMTGDKNRHVCGDGSGSVKISTTSGDVRIDAAE